jgi:hypothetical protein
MLGLDDGLACVPPTLQQRLSNSNDCGSTKSVSDESDLDKYCSQETINPLNMLPPNVSSGVWKAIRSSDMPDMITYELHAINATTNIGFHHQTRDVDRKQQCVFETLASSNFLAPEGPLRRYIYRDLYGTVLHLYLYLHY